MPAVTTTSSRELHGRGTPNRRALDHRQPRCRGRPHPPTGLPLARIHAWRDATRDPPATEQPNKTQAQIDRLARDLAASQQRAQRYRQEQEEARDQAKTLANASRALHEENQSLRSALADARVISPLPRHADDDWQSVPRSQSQLARPASSPSRSTAGACATGSGSTAKRKAPHASTCSASVNLGMKRALSRRSRRFIVMRQKGKPPTMPSPHSPGNSNITNQHAFRSSSRSLRCCVTLIPTARTESLGCWPQPQPCRSLRRISDLSIIITTGRAPEDMTQDIYGLGDSLRNVRSAVASSPGKIQGNVRGD